MSDTAGQGATSYTLSDYAAMFRRRWGWLVLGLIIGIAMAWFVIGRLSPTYLSEANVLVEPTGVSSTSVADGRTSGEINLDTEAQLVTSAEVATRAQETLASRVPLTELIEQVSVTVPPNSQILTISFEADTAGAARQGAQAFAQAYLDSRAELAVADVKARTAELQEQIKSESTALSEVLVQLSGREPDDPDRVFDESRSTQLSDRIASLNEQIQGLSALDDRPGRIINPAILPDSRSGPSPAMIYASTLMLGLLVGVGMMLLRARTDQRLLTADEAAGDTELRVIGLVPPTTSWGADPKDERTAYERLRNVVVSTAGHHRVLLITGIDRHASVATVASKLATVLAATGRRVVLIDATPSVTAGQPNDEPGLSDALADGRLVAAGVSVWEAAWSVAAPADYLHVGPGRRPDLLHHLLASPPASSSFDDLRQLVDLALVVAPHDDVASSQTIATLADGVIHVAVSRRSRRPDLVAAVQRVAQVGTPSIGLVIVDYPPRIVAVLRAIAYSVRSRRAAAAVPPSSSSEVDVVDPAATGVTRADPEATREIEVAPPAQPRPADPAGATSSIAGVPVPRGAVQNGSDLSSERPAEARSQPQADELVAGSVGAAPVPDAEAAQVVTDVAAGADGDGARNKRGSRPDGGPHVSTHTRPEAELPELSDDENRGDELREWRETSGVRHY